MPRSFKKTSKEIDRQPDGLLQMVRRDLRQPLKAIDGVLIALQNGDCGTLSDRGKKLAATAANATGKMLTILNDLLDVNHREDDTTDLDSNTHRMTERLRGEVLRMVNDDVKTPLFTVSSFLEMASEGFFCPLTESGRKSLADARTRTNQMLALVEDLLTLEKIQSGLHELSKEEVPLLAVLQESLAAVEAETIAKKIKTERQFADLKLIADSGMLRKAMYRVMFVIVAMLPPGGALVVKAGQIDKFCQISLMAQGEGPSQQALLSMFDQYAEPDPALPYHAGSRLSLCVTRAVVELNGGSVSAQVADGTYGFVINLPL